MRVLVLPIIFALIVWFLYLLARPRSHGKQ
jgi:hypothetical protein